MMRRFILLSAFSLPSVKMRKLCPQSGQQTVEETFDCLERCIEPWFLLGSGELSFGFACVALSGARP